MHPYLKEILLALERKGAIHQVEVSGIPGRSGGQTRKNTERLSFKGRREGQAWGRSEFRVPDGSLVVSATWQQEQVRSLDFSFPPTVAMRDRGYEVAGMRRWGVSRGAPGRSAAPTEAGGAAPGTGRAGQEAPRPPGRSLLPLRSPTRGSDSRGGPGLSEGPRRLRVRYLPGCHFRASFR